MEEPQIYDFYNEMPSMVNVIDGMNKELSDVQDELSKMKDKYEPIVVINNEIRDKFHDTLKDKITEIITPRLYRNTANNLYGHVNGCINWISCTTSHRKAGKLYKILKDYFMDISKNEGYSDRISSDICTNMMAFSKSNYLNEDNNISLNCIINITVNILNEIIYMIEITWKEKCNQCGNIVRDLYDENGCEECYWKCHCNRCGNKYPDLYDGDECKAKCSECKAICGDCDLLFRYAPELYDGDKCRACYERGNHGVI